MLNRVIFAGTPNFAKEHLQALIDNNIIPVAVYTQPDRKVGRGHKLCPSPVKELALLHKIPVFTPENFKNEEDIKIFENHNATIAIVVAYGVILPQRIIDAPTFGCINVHGSLLPKYRGAAPIQRSLLDGDKKTGVSIMKIVKALDAGAVYYTKEIDILNTDTSETLFNKLAKLGSEALIESLPLILNKKLEAKEQDENLVTYAKKLDKEEALINFNDDAKTVERKIRGYNPWPIAYFKLQDTTYKVFKAKVLDESSSSYKLGSIVRVDKNGIVVSCSDRLIALEIIQAPGKGQVLAYDYARNKKDLFVEGTCFE